MTKSTQIFENLEKNKEKIFIYLFFEFLMMRDKNMKMTHNMKIMNQNSWCMQEHYECQDEHQEYFEDHDEHQEKNFWCKENMQDTKLRNL